MPFRLFWRRPAPPAPQDPLEAYAQVISSLEAQGEAVRKAAATLLVARGELKRRLERLASQRAALAARLDEAALAGDLAAGKALRADRLQVDQQAAQAEATLERTDADAQVLLGTAERLKASLLEVSEEERLARAQLLGGQAVSVAHLSPGAQWQRQVKLDAARDEVERAHALADLYREEERARQR